MKKENILLGLMLSSSLIACNLKQKDTTQKNDQVSKIETKGVRIAFDKNSDFVKVYKSFEPEEGSTERGIQEIYNLKDSTVVLMPEVFTEGMYNTYSSTQLRHWKDFGTSEKEEFIELKKIRLEKYKR